MPFDPERVSQALLDHCEDWIAKGIAPILARNEELALQVLGLEEQLASMALTLAAVAAEAAAAVPLVEIEAPEPRDWTPEIEAVRAAIPAPVEMPDLSGFALKEHFELVLASIPVLPEPPDLTGFATKAELEAVRSVIPEPVEPPELTGFALKEDIEALRATIPAPVEPPDLSGLASKTELEEVRAAIPNPQWLEFATKAEVEAVYAAIPELPDLSGFAIKAELEDVRAAIPAAPDLTGFASKESLEEIRLAIPASPEPPDLSGFATVAQLEAIELMPGPPGPLGLLPPVEIWTDRVHYEGECCTHRGALFQAMRDTGSEPPHEHWQCLAARGEDGLSLSFTGTFDPERNYGAFDVAMLNGSSFVAKHADPGDCPGDGWQLVASAGSKGKPGEGRPGPPGVGLIDIYREGQNVSFVDSGGKTHTISLPEGVGA